MKSTKNTKKAVPKEGDARSIVQGLSTDEKMSILAMKHFADSVAKVEQYLDSYVPSLQEVVLALWRYRIAGTEPDGELLNKLPQYRQDDVACVMRKCLEFSESSKLDADWWNKIIDALLEKLPEKQRQLEVQQVCEDAMMDFLGAIDVYGWKMQTRLYKLLTDLLTVEEVASSIGTP